jgi:hypothetical protein
MGIKNWKLYLESNQDMLGYDKRDRYDNIVKNQKQQLKKLMEDLEDSLVELTDWRECIFFDNDYNKAYIPMINIFVRLQEDASVDKEYLNNLGGHVDLPEVDFDKFESEELIEVIGFIEEGIVRSQIEYKNVSFYLGLEDWNGNVGDLCYLLAVKIDL